MLIQLESLFHHCRAKTANSHDFASVCCLLGEERTYPHNVVEDESAGVDCHSDGNKGELIIQSRSQVPYSLIPHGVLSDNGKVTDRRCLPWKEEQRDLVEVELKVVHRRPWRDFRQRFVLPPGFLTRENKERVEPH